MSTDKSKGLPAFRAAPESDFYEIRKFIPPPERIGRDFERRFDAMMAAAIQAAFAEAVMNNPEASTQVNKD